jgi:hypothetical protein
MAGYVMPDSDEFAPEVRIVRKTDALFTWTATVKFATTYDLPEGVVEQAVVRAIRDSSEVVIERLQRGHSDSSEANS